MWSDAGPVAWRATISGSVLISAAPPKIDRASLMLRCSSNVWATRPPACPGGADPYAGLGVLIEGTVQTLVEHIPKERQAETAATLKQLLDEWAKACGVPDGDG